MSARPDLTLIADIRARAATGEAWPVDPERIIARLEHLEASLLAMVREHATACALATEANERFADLLERARSS